MNLNTIKKPLHLLVLVALIVSFSVQATANKITGYNSVFPSIQTNHQLQEYYYVSAASGLNYRATPKGTILGKFDQNTKVYVVEHTAIKEDLIDGVMVITGEWVGVKHQNAIVYVFSGYLSRDITYSDIHLYYTSTSYKTYEGAIKNAFLNVSETYFTNRYTRNSNYEKTPIISPAQATSNTVRLNKIQRKEFLKRMRLSENDSVYIYNLLQDRINSYVIKNLPVIACLSPYFNDNYDHPSEDDYQIGFDLGIKEIDDENFTVVGRNNPFQTGKLTRFLWEPIDSSAFPKPFSTNTDSQYEKEDLKGLQASDSYAFYTDDLDYFIQNLKNENQLDYRYLVVRDAHTKAIIFEQLQRNSESSHLIPLAIKGHIENDFYKTQWTGKPLKNLPTTLYGFEGYSFGCPSLVFIDKRKPTLPILCDNRH
ncbi:SH3 domain-containing protein [Bizionia paragorgiae]|uniref:SH3 domain-containing protein n=1 Tax=Bizionia paragorgiae TaxID=283786 RepID=A0A1H3XPN5_BIZPA|nr:SH3 domain-containing protein [Bizionia paragorgiae]SEA01313.1 SH3 domain-containing protein [Bizionia paragorgiae]